MKKGYYIHFEGSKVVGVQKKIMMQIGILNKYSSCRELEVVPKTRTFLNRLAGLFFWNSIPWNYESVKELIDNPDYIYIRRVNIDFDVFCFFRYLSDTYPDTHILLEVPTFPYDRQSFKSIFAWPFAIKDMYYRKRIHKYIDKIVVYSDAEIIWNIDTIPINNGVDFNNVTLPERIVEDDTIDLLTVSSFQKDHGYERIIEGLHRYYSNGGIRSIQLHMVGNGRELDYYRSLVSQYGLEKNVLFYGECRGEDLERIYGIADVGLGCFGLYKSGLTHISSLKICEYLAKGLPVIFAGIEYIMKDKDESFALMLNNDSTPVDMQCVIEFYDRIYQKNCKKIDIRKSIRKAGYPIADMEKNYTPVLKYLDIV